MIWDGSPNVKTAGTVWRVWDERQMKEKPLEGWIMEVKSKNGSFLLPRDAGTQAVPWESRIAWPLRTWDGTDGSLWIGEAAKNAAWKALRRTREALEKYK